MSQIPNVMLRFEAIEFFLLQVVADLNTAHRANIFSAKFLSCSGDSKIVSCSGDGTLAYTDVERFKETYR